MVPTNETEAAVSKVASRKASLRSALTLMPSPWACSSPADSAVRRRQPQADDQRAEQDAAGDRHAVHIGFEQAAEQPEDDLLHGFRRGQKQQQGLQRLKEEQHHDAAQHQNLRRHTAALSQQIDRYAGQQRH